MRTIWRYDIDGFGPQTLRAPAGARPIYAGVHRDTPAVWFEVETDNAPVLRVVQIIGTGHERPDGTHIGTYLEGPLVWHFYDLGEAASMTREEWDRA